MVIGTHSRSIEGRLIELLLQRKWSLENEQPFRSCHDGGRSNIIIDGTQVSKIEGLQGDIPPLNVFDGAVEIENVGHHNSSA